MKEFLTAQDIADLLRISRLRVYELFRLNPSHGGIPHYTIGTSKRVDKADFEKWLQARFKGVS